MKVVEYIVSAVGMAALAVALFTAGYFACSAPLTTEILSQGTSDYVRSPYALDDLNSLACASRNLTVDARASSDPQQARRVFNETLMLAATHSCERYLGGDVNGFDHGNSDKRQLWQGLLAAMDASTSAQAFTLEDVNGTAQIMAEYSDAFALDADAFSHLDDCNALIQRGVLAATISFFTFLVAFVVLLLMRRWKAAGRLLTIAPIVLLVLFLAMGIWAFLDFHSFFSAFHGLFFPQGNWTFSIDSLLICMYPTAFWMGMGIIWLATTVLASIICLVIGRKVARIGR